MNDSEYESDKKHGDDIEIPACERIQILFLLMKWNAMFHWITGQKRKRSLK